MELLLEDKNLVIPAGLTRSATFALSPAEGTYLIPDKRAQRRFFKRTRSLLSRRDGAKSQSSAALLDIPI